VAKHSQEGGVLTPPKRDRLLTLFFRWASGLWP